LFLSDYLKKAKRRDKRVPDSRLQAEARDLWRNTDKKEKKKWLKMLEPQRQRYIEAYTSKTKFGGLKCSVADPDPDSGAFLTPGSGMGKKSGSGMNNPDHIFLRAY
jgi:hypothetical protein